MIHFNKPYFTGKETEYIQHAVQTGKISGNGIYTKKCQDFFEKRYGFGKCLLTTSCTDALEMAAILCNIVPGDEVIVPSYTFVSTALAFVRQGAKIVFADSLDNHPNIDADKIESLINSQTKVIVPVHYGGVACDMDKIMSLAEKYKLFVVEDAAQAIDSYYISKDNIKIPLGKFGHFSTFSFHETKNIISGEGGMLVINDKSYFDRAEIIWEKGTNRNQFFRGEVDKYGWVDIGSSFLPSEIISAFLWAQIENLDKIQDRRLFIWNKYYQLLKSLSNSNTFSIPIVPNNSTNNAHLFYIICPSIEIRTKLITKFRENEILAVFHYLSLHKSNYYYDKHDGRDLLNADKYSDCLLRLPMYYELTDEDFNKIVSVLTDFYN